MAKLTSPPCFLSPRRKKKSKSSSKPKDEISGTPEQGAAGGSRRKTEAERRFEEMQRERVSPRRFFHFLSFVRES